MPNPCPLHPAEPGRPAPFEVKFGPFAGRSGIWQCNALMGFNPDGSPVKGSDKTGRCKFMWDPNAVAAVLPPPQPLNARAASEMPQPVSMEPRLTAMGMALNAAAVIHQGNLGPTDNIIAMAKRFYFELLEAAALGTLEP